MYVLFVDCKKVEYTINTQNESYTHEHLRTIRETVGDLISAKYDDIIVTGVKEGSVLVTFMIKGRFIPKLRSLYTQRNRSTTCATMFQRLKYEVMKVTIQDQVIYEKVTTIKIYFNQYCVGKTND